MAVILSQQQFSAIQGVARVEWCAAVAQDLFDATASYYVATGATPASLTGMVQAVADWARRFEVRGNADVTRLCHVAASLGHRFWLDPRFRGYVDAAMSPDVPPGRRATVMTDETKGWLRGLWGGDRLRNFSERLANLVRDKQAAHAHHMQYLLPGHWQMFSEPDNERLLGWLAQTAPEDLRDEGPRQLAYTACALVHGTRWLDDPQYPRLAKTVRARTDAARLADDLAQIYAEATA